MRDPYSVLGITRDATDEEVKNAYRDLARKYHPDNYRDDNPLKDLAKDKMQEINAAYDEIQRQRQDKSRSNSGNDAGNSGSGYQDNSIYVDVRNKINQRKYREAENLLSSIAEFDRTADWHFLTAVCLKQRGMNSDAIRELEIACSMDPSNMEYQRAKEAFNATTNSYGSTYYGPSAPRQRSSTDDACDCCANLICLDCLCECMGGDLIRCI